MKIGGEGGGGEIIHLILTCTRYLCIAGCPEKTDDHAERIANMALEMVESVKSIIAPDGTQVRVRIGMHTGPVIAGVVGIKMIHYQVSFLCFPPTPSPLSPPALPLPLFTKYL